MVVNLLKTIKEYTELAAYRLISYDKIPSTQTVAHDLIAHGGASDKTVVVANVQTAGRGRYRRRWVSPRGNLYASFIFRCPTRDPRISYAVAVAIAETVILCGGRPEIKWPNDILVNGAKICGVLIEYSGDFVIVGIGINIMSAPNVPDYKTAKTTDFSSVSRSEILSRLMRNLDVWCKRDFADVRGRWMDLAAGLGQPVTWHDRVMRLIEIDENGGLVLKDDDGQITVYGDEISMHKQDS